jgi:GT2 family glycosyltransferase
VIATHDRRHQLLHTLQRLRALPERPPIVVVDNGSSDGTPDVVRALAGTGKTGKADEADEAGALSVIELGENRGSRARDVGVEAATTPYVAFADDDSWWAPGSLTRAEGLFDAHPSVAVLAARILVGHAQTLDPVCRQMAASPLDGRDGLPGPRVLGFVACGAVVRRNAFLAVGGFDDVLFFRCEEGLLAMDLARDGWDLVYVDDLVAHHHPSPSRDPDGQRAVVLRNDLLTAWMRRPLGVAVDATLDLARLARKDPAARTALRQATGRLRAALARRRVVPADVEEDLRTITTVTPAAGSPPR